MKNLLEGNWRYVSGWYRTARMDLVCTTYFRASEAIVTKHEDEEEKKRKAMQDAVNAAMTKSLIDNVFA